MSYLLLRESYLDFSIHQEKIWVSMIASFPYDAYKDSWKPTYLSNSTIVVLSEFYQEEIKNCLDFFGMYIVFFNLFMYLVFIYLF